MYIIFMMFFAGNANLPGLSFHTPAWIGVFVYVHEPQPGLIMFFTSRLSFY